MADWWQEKPWRFIQTNLREIDMRDISAERVVADMQAFSANVLMINAAGIIASYPTELPFHFQSPHLQGDSLKEIISSCHKADIHVMARTDFSKIRRPIYELHPEWASLTSDGRVIDYNGDIQVCVNGQYQQEYALKIIEELITTHDFDGIFFNMGGYKTSDYSGEFHGNCHCENCKRLFQEMFGLLLPKSDRGNDPVHRKYNLFKQRTLKAHHEKVYAFISELRPDICIANHREFRRGFNRMESNTAMDRALPHWQYNASDNTKKHAGGYPQMACSNTTVDFIDFPYRHVAVSPHQQTLRLAQNLANNGSLDYYLIGRLDNHEDRSGFEGIKQIYHYHSENEVAYVNNRSKANIALLVGETNEYRGWFRFLVENHYLFDALTPEAADNLDWDRYQAIILPDLPNLGDNLAQRLNDFVQNGGTLISILQSGFRDSSGEIRESPVPTCLGIERVGRIRKDMRSSYFKVEDKGGFERLEDIDLLYMDGSYVYADYAGDVAPHFRLIPPHRFGPPEQCYYTEVTDHPGFTVRSFGKGKTIYLPWSPGKLFHRQGYPNTFEFISDLLESVAGLTPVGGNLSPMVEVTVVENPGQNTELVHLVNASGHYGVSFFPPVTMQNLEITVPCNSKPRSVSSLLTKLKVPFTFEEEKLTISVSKLELFDAIQIDLGGSE